MSRSRTVERRRQREQEQRRQRQLAAVVVIVALVVLGFVLFLIANQPVEVTIPEEALTLYEGIPQFTTPEGFAGLGDPDAAVQVVEYSSFDCTHCATFHQEVVPALLERVRAGEIAFTFVSLYGTGSVQNGQGAARAAICAGEQDAFWPYHTTLFDWQRQYANTAFQGNRLGAAADELGLDRGAWDSCIGSSRPDDVTDAATEAARAVPGFAGTPTVTVNGVNTPNTLSDLNAAIDQALASAGPVVPAAESTAAPEATTEPAAEATVESGS
jgi:protein-disulfide isomerase